MKPTLRKPQNLSKSEWEHSGNVGDDDDIEQNTHEFQFSFHGLSSSEAAEQLRVYGRNELPQKHTPKWLIFVALLWEPMPVMIWIAIIIEAILGKWMDMGILLGIQMTNASIAFYETTKSGDAVAALKASLRPLATVRRDGEWKHIDAVLLVPGDLISLSSGSAIPADCRINEGTVELDQAALTGESLPVAKFKGDSCQMGATVVRGEVEATVEFTGAGTFFGRTASLLQVTGEVSNLQSVLMDIMIVLVVLSITLCAVVYLHLAHITSVVEALSFTVVLMVASIPLAIEIVTTTTLALGSKELSKHGAIVTRLSAIEDMAGMAVLCSDKTGTLTLNKMQLQAECPIYSRGETQYSLLRYAAMATKWKEPPKDALDTLTLTAADLISLETVEQLEFMPFDPVVKRTEGTIRDKLTGNIFRVTKGAPHVILKMLNAQSPPPGTEQNLLAQVERDIQSLGERGIRCLAVARTPDNQTLGDAWVLLGILTFLDPPRPDTLQTIQDARRFGVAVKMITGDHLLIAKETSRTLTLGTNILPAHTLPDLDPVTQSKPANLSAKYGAMIMDADGFAEVFPEHKYLIVECLRELGYKTGMTGDGVNDAPALKRADVGVAVSGATDAACAAADIVLTQPGLSTIVHGILIARCIFIRIRNFITYRIAATLQLLLFFFIAIFAFRPAEYEPEDMDDHNWPNFFHMPVIMLMLITLLNDGTLIAIGYDNVDAPRFPTVWNLRVLFVIGIVLAGVACMSSLLLLYWLLDSWRKHSVFDYYLGIGGISYGQITTSIFLKVAVSDFLTLFSARAGEDWFWSSRPAPVLLAAAGFALSLSTFFACIWPLSRPDGIPTVGLERKEPYILPVFIWVYCIIWWFIQDAAKVYTYKLLKRYNVFQYNDTGMLPTFDAKAYSESDMLLLNGLNLPPISPHSPNGRPLSPLRRNNSGGVGPHSPNGHGASMGLGRSRSDSSGAGDVAGVGALTGLHYDHPSGAGSSSAAGAASSAAGMQHAHSSSQHPYAANAAATSSSLINAAAAAVAASSVAGTQLLYGKVRSKTAGYQYGVHSHSSSGGGGSGLLGSLTGAGMSHRLSAASAGTAGTAGGAVSAAAASVGVGVGVGGGGGMLSMLSMSADKKGKGN